ncbi:nuclease-related domain-containing DEAD/DEAH box helicase [Ruegeria atlantica]|uniref:DNA 3'-5' helicase II n=1 Tax=Ruegeria atlantica TaxID=81569 RepID=A0A0N7LPX5_9RHOB|nr:NERD domain-containing protein/DEAD/DEAH box helicase [Ruegeria atlantica]CUH46436.1 Superfamily I DNA and RNA helicases [Ruegeria atlantica]
MAVLYPDYRGDFRSITSAAEVKFYEACSRLPDDFHVFHSVAWISRSGGVARDGEADFLICHPDRGFLVVEVKGGRIEADYSSGTWISIDRNGKRNPIKDPFKQATNAKYNILSKLKENRDWGRLGLKRVAAGHAAFFPDVDDARRLQGPAAPVDIIGDRSDIVHLEDWLLKSFDFWAAGEEGARVDPLGPGGIRLVEKTLARVVEARPLFSAQISEDERKRLELTERQLQILDLLSRQRRVSISGGAGTGKTVLATEKARRLADEGFKTLLTCYNVPLARHLEEICAGNDNLDVFGFHKLCKSIVDEANAVSGRDILAEVKADEPGKDLWDDHYPIALAYALEIVDRRYDAIVIDEGQDFGEEFWLPIEMMLTDGTKSPLYIFHDENQNVYDRASTFPTDAAPITLSTNCRNTLQIHDVAYRFYSGSPVDPPELQGRDIERIHAPDIDRQAKEIHQFVSKLMVNEKVEPKDIAVLIGNRRKRKDYETSLNKFKLPGGSNWKNVDGTGDRDVVLESVARFKGLEADVLVLWGLDDLPEDEKKSTFYVGSSRAKSHLVLCGLESSCDEVLSIG